MKLFIIALVMSTVALAIEPAPQVKPQDAARPETAPEIHLAEDMDAPEDESRVSLEVIEVRPNRSRFPAGGRGNYFR